MNSNFKYWRLKFIIYSINKLYITHLIPNFQIFNSLIIHCFLYLFILNEKLKLIQNLFGNFKIQYTS